MQYMTLECVRIFSSNITLYYGIVQWLPSYMHASTVLALINAAATIVGATSLLRLLMESGSYSREALIKWKAFSKVQIARQLSLKCSTCCKSSGQMWNENVSTDAKRTVKPPKRARSKQQLGKSVNWLRRLSKRGVYLRAAFIECHHPKAAAINRERLLFKKRRLLKRVR